MSTNVPSASTNVPSSPIRKPTYDLVAIARQFLYVREAQTIGQNRGLRVESIQHWAGGAWGDSWCMEFVWMCLDIAYQGHPPIDRMQSCEALRAWAQDAGREVATPCVGDLYLYVDAAERAHHVGIVTVVPSDRRGGGDGGVELCGIAGNTSADGTSDNGDRVAERAISAKLFVRL